MKPLTQSKTVIYLLVVSFTPNALLADDEPIESFGKRAAIVDGVDSLRRVELPFAVLVDSQPADFSNIHVFDATGQLVPSRNQTLATARESLDSEVELPFYPFAQDAQADAIRSSFEVSQTATNTQISVTASADGTPSAQTNYIVYLSKEVRKRHGQVQYLILNWSSPTDNLIVPVKVEGSADLQKWTTLAERVVVSDLSHDGNQLLRNHVPLRKSGHAYLRVTWPDSIKQFDVDRVVGSFTRSRTKPIARRNHTLYCAPLKSNGNTCQFKVGENTILTRIDIPTIADEFYIHGALYSSDTAEGPWVHRRKFQQYKLTIDGQQVEEMAIKHDLSSDRHWQVRFDPNGGNLVQGNVKVDVEWYPRYQVFLAQGQSPYQLAYDNPQAVNDTHKVIANVLKRTGKKIDDVELVGLGPIRSVQPVVEYWTRQRIETFGLWAALLIGVGVLGRIAWNLFHSIRAESS